MWSAEWKIKERGWVEWLPSSPYSFIIFISLLISFLLCFSKWPWHKRNTHSNVLRDLMFQFFFYFIFCPAKFILCHWGEFEHWSICPACVHSPYSTRCIWCKITYLSIYAQTLWVCVATLLLSNFRAHQWLLLFLLLYFLL